MLNGYLKLARLYGIGGMLAQVMLKGYINPDSKINNIGLRPGHDPSAPESWVFVDYSDLCEIPVSEKIDTDTLRCISTSLETIFFNADSMDLSFLLNSYIVAGFSAYGGILADIVLANMLNDGYSPLLYLYGNETEYNFDILQMYKDLPLMDIINEWISLPKESIDLQRFPSLEKYQKSDIRSRVSDINKMYLDRLYLNRSYVQLLLNRAYPMSVVINNLNMAEMFYNMGRNITAYGLFLKCLNYKENNAYSKVAKEHIDLIKKEHIVTQDIDDIINEKKGLEVFQLIWLLNELYLSTMIKND